jgi:hypothetical protein
LVYIHKSEQVEQALNLTKVDDLKKLEKVVKLPTQVISRLIDLIIYSYMESSLSNPTVHRTYRLMVKKRLYIRCMRGHPELFKGKKELLEARKNGDETKILEH